MARRPPACGEVLESRGAVGLRLGGHPACGRDSFEVQLRPRRGPRPPSQAVTASRTSRRVPPPRFEHSERQLRSSTASSSGAPRDIEVRPSVSRKGAHFDTPPPRPGCAGSVAPLERRPWRSRSTRPARNRTPSARRRRRCRVWPPAARGEMRPPAPTTRCQGTPAARVSGRARSAQPTARAPCGTPRSAAICPYVATRPRGTSATRR
jgi:hypothetical protein